jgi:DNA polymerase III subunit delta
VEAVYTKESAKTLFDPIQKVYAFYGEDDQGKDEALDLLRSKAVDEGFTDFDFEVVDADVRPVEEILAAAGMAPFASPVRLVVVRGAEIYRKRERSSEAERLAQGIAALGACSCLALRVGAAEDERSRGKTILSAKLDAAIKANGAAVQFKALTENALVSWLDGEAREAGKSLDEAAALRLIQAARGERTALGQELEKAICYAGDAKHISLEMVEATCTYDPEDVMFKLVDAISQRNADRALRLFHELLRYDNKPQRAAGRLLALLSRQFRMLTQASELARKRVDAGMLKSLPPDVAGDLPTEGSIVSMAWKGRELFGMARAWDRKALAETYGLLLECDLNNKGGTEGSEDVVTNLELLILKLCRTK